LMASQEREFTGNCQGGCDWRWATSDGAEVVRVAAIHSLTYRHETKVSERVVTTKVVAVVDFR
jgi:predicted small metal-binding protein